MGYVARFHRAYRKLLLLFNRLNSVKLVKADVDFVCCHVAELRVAFSTSQQSHNNRLRVAIIRVRIPLSLGKAMRSSTITRYAIANEIIRRKNQPGCDRTLHPRRHRSRPALITFCFGEILDAQTPIEQQSGERSLFSGSVDPPATELQPHVEAFHKSITQSESYSTLQAARRRKLSMWKPRIALRQSNDHFAALRHKVKESFQDPSIPSVVSSHPTETDQVVKLVLKSNEDGDLPTPCPLETRLDSDTFDATCRFPLLQMDLDNHKIFEDHSHPNLPSLMPEDQNESASPTSDTTLTEEPTIQSLRQLKCSESLEEDMSFDGTERQVALHKESVKIRAAQRARHRRNFSIDSAWSTSRTPSVPLRERAKTNDGMLQFKASPSKLPRSSIAPNMHRRKISLNLPIKSVTVQSEVVQQTTTESSDTESVYHTPYSHYIPSSDLTQEERELEYKQRHTFVGTASLDDLLERLELSVEQNTTKDAVAKAFILLSSTEQLHARQCSTEPYGWELVSRITPDVSNINYVAQWQVKLGSITLRQFLDLIPFDEKEECSALCVMEAFLAASHIDGRIGTGTASKARAFRSWMVQQDSIGD